MTHFDGIAGRTVIITGGTSGIGADVVRAFAANDARVAFLGRQQEAGDALVAELAPKALFVRCDLLDLAAMRAAFETIKAQLGPASVLVNNAANDQRHHFEDVTEAEFERMMGVNFRHVFFACQIVLPQMRALGGGSIINMSSGAWVGGVSELETYSAAKAAIVGLTNSLARSVGRDRIRVNALVPGMIFTERQRRLWFKDESQVTAGLARQCIPEEVTGADCAQAALFLASDASRMITKQFLMVNGGLR
jgi:NAD(P)-dependent dehydrogenase (short-subunit alcohol dehydrogenase family)